VVTGSKRGGALQTIVGAVLIVVGLVITGGTFGAGAPFGSAFIMMGGSMVLGGVIQMLSPQAGGLKTSAAPENTPGYAFGSAKNNTASGNPVPLCYGKRRVGGAIISGAIYTEDQMCALHACKIPSTCLHWSTLMQACPFSYASMSEPKGKAAGAAARAKPYRRVSDPKSLRKPQTHSGALQRLCTLVS
jgi:hypothetical protein